MMAFYLFITCSTILVIGSLIKPHRHTEHSIKLVWNRPWECLQSRGWPGLLNYRFLAAVLFGIMAILYFVFR
jgi:solute:Na+ symporter, SSS family